MSFSASFRTMPEVTQLSPELSRSVPALPCALVAASRRWSPYPPDHPAVRTSAAHFSPRLPALAGRVLTFM
jgi:hypothetical protein